MELSEAILKGCEITPHQVFGAITGTVWFNKKLLLPLLEPEMSLLDVINDQFFLTVEPVMGTCVMGAAYEGVFGPLKEQGSVTIGNTIQQWCFTLLDREFPILRQHIDVEIPVLDPVMRVQPNGQRRISFSHTYSAALKNIIIELNDRHHWSREQIAAWLKYVVEGQPMIPED